MVTKIMEWVSFTALLMVASWRPIASHHKAAIDRLLAANRADGS